MLFQYASALEKNKLFVKNLPFTCTKEALQILFGQVYYSSVAKLSRAVRKLSLGFLNMSDINLAIQSQKMDRSLKFCT